jgi:hypothetical protein
MEEALQVDVVSTALLGLPLVPILRRGRRGKRGDELPVLEIVASGNHEGVQIPEEKRARERLMAAYNET